MYKHLANILDTLNLMIEYLLLFGGRGHLQYMYNLFSNIYQLPSPALFRHINFVDQYTSMQIF